MRRLLNLLIFCLVISFFVLFAVSFPNTARANTPSPPVAVDDGPYVVRIPSGFGNVYGEVQPPGWLANDTWDTNESLGWYPWNTPDAQHASNLLWLGTGGFRYYSSGSYVGFAILLCLPAIVYALGFGTIMYVFTKYRNRQS